MFLQCYILVPVRWAHPKKNDPPQIIHSFKSVDTDEISRQNVLPFFVTSPLFFVHSLVPLSLFSTPKAHLLVFLLAVAAGVHFLSVHFLQKP